LTSIRAFHATTRNVYASHPRICAQIDRLLRRAKGELGGTEIAVRKASGAAMMSLVRLLGFTTLDCGCVTGRYREIATNREITYVEEKGLACGSTGHRRNQTLAPARFSLSALSARAS
jgi:hypothetical protein